MTVTKPGKLIDGRFRITDYIGSGGFGAVYRARDEQLDRDVAVKVLDCVDPMDSMADERFRREAKVLSQINHANIVQVYSFGREEGGRPYIVMQLLHGRTLQELLESEGKLEWKRCLHIFVQAAFGLAAAHEAGVVHRDLKPANIMLLDEPEPDTLKILDFGLSAILFDSPEKLQRLTQTGNVVGTVFYLSPEAAQGQQAEPRSDIYSLGCVLYEALAGHPPYTSTDGLSLLYSHVHDTPRRFDSALGLPEALERVIFKATQKDPADRFASMMEFEQALRMVLENRAGHLALGSLPLPPSPRKRLRLPIYASIFMAALILACAFLVPGLMPVHRPSKPLVDWATQQQKAQKEWDKRHYAAAWTLYKSALGLASRGVERAITEVAMGRYATVPEILNKYSRELQPVLVDGVAGGTSTAQRAEARCYLGICQFVNGDYDGAYSTLVGEPWLLLERSDTFVRNHGEAITRVCISALGQSSAKCSAPNYDMAIRLLSPFPRFDEAQTLSTVPRDLVLARIFLMSPKTKEQGLRILESISPFLSLSAPDDLQFARTALGATKFDQLVREEQARDQIQLAKLPEISRSRQFLFSDGAPAVYRGIHLSSESAADPLMVALQLKYQLAAARSVNEITGLLNTPRPASDDANINAVLATCEGVAYADLNQPEKTIEKLGSQPWLQADHESLAIEAKDAAAECLAKAYVMSTVQRTPDKALELLKALTNKDGAQTSRVSFLYGAALLEDGDKAGARYHLARVTPYRFHGLNQKELVFLKDLLATNSMTDLWKL
jgi:serine/threonine protein kinase